MISGLELAVWKDGTILVAASERRLPGQGILVGKVDPKDLETALKQISDAAFFDSWSSRVVVGGGSTSISVEHGDKVATVARTETLMPGVGVNVSADPRSRALVRMWRRTRGAIEGISPIELSLLEKQIGKQGTFRGYNLNNPVSTAWRPQ